ncbi:hypothetical protein [Acidiphilium iwatense]|uniref:Uncharacterized protein n=1 Tax=Acidiphilium iwatense TaxID=768198 RepID=A0ABS9DRG8_9PROT|nr:hypothetical protein [Acidiphilium iwatense]MCF3945351.1 hypothetical protein [Acidiphilium iwatense]
MIETMRSTVVFSAGCRRRWSIAAGLIAILALPPTAFARSPGYGANGPPTQPATVKVLSFELVPLSANQLQSEAGRGIPSEVPGTVVPKPGNGTIKLWDEVPTVRVITTQASETLTINLAR